MSDYTTSDDSVVRPLRVMAGVVYVELIAILSYVSGTMGIIGHGGATDKLTAIPNLITAVTASVGGGSYFAMRRPAFPLFCVATISLGVTQALAYLQHLSHGPVWTVGVVILSVPCVLFLLVTTQAGLLSRDSKLR